MKLVIKMHCLRLRIVRMLEDFMIAVGRLGKE
jgi:hypothetical protein